MCFYRQELLFNVYRIVDRDNETIFSQQEWIGSVLLDLETLVYVPNRRIVAHLTNPSRQEMSSIMTITADEIVSYGLNINFDFSHERLELPSECKHVYLSLQKKRGEFSVSIILILPPPLFT